MKRILILSLLFILTVWLISYKVTLALFSDSAQSQNNTFTAAEVFPPGLGDVVINEIMWMGSSANSLDEWIELRNMTDDTVDISSWVVEGLGSGGTPNITINPSSSIPSNGFFLISNHPSTSANSILDANPDQTTASVSLLNGGEQLILKDSGGNTIDTANVSPDWFAGVNDTVDGVNRSMERKTSPNDGTVVGNWHSSNDQIGLDPEVSDFATPKSTNSTGL